MLLSVDWHLFTDVSWQLIGPTFKALEPEDFLFRSEVPVAGHFPKPRFTQA
jgi:hypothetical protein